MLRPALFIAALLAATAAVAAGPRDTMLVTSDWLAQHLNDANLVILHAGAQGDYTAGHIPGARLAPQDALSASAAASGGLTLELPTSGDLQFKMTEFGISDNSRIVVYANRQTEPDSATRPYCWTGAWPIGGARTMRPRPRFRRPSRAECRASPCGPRPWM